MKYRLHAALFHLILNLISFAVLLAVLTKLWYPAPFFTASGGLEGLKIVAFVDIVLGPMLTFVVFTPHKSKKLLKQDVIIIGLLQICAFVWGVHTIYAQRPVATVFWENQFYSVNAKSIKQAGFNINDLDNFGQKKPVMVYIDRPTTPDSAAELSERIKSEQHPPFDFVDLYQNVDGNFEEIKNYALNLGDILNKNVKMKKTFMKLIEKHQALTTDNAIAIKLSSKYRNTIVIFDQQGNHLGYINAPLRNN